MSYVRLKRLLEAIERQKEIQAARGEIKFEPTIAPEITKAANNLVDKMAASMRPLTDPIVQAAQEHAVAQARVEVAEVRVEQADAELKVAMKELGELRLERDVKKKALQELVAS